MPFECYYCHKPLYSIHEKHTEADCVAYLQQRDRELRAKQAKTKPDHSPTPPAKSKAAELSDK